MESEPGVVPLACTRDEASDPAARIADPVLAATPRFRTELGDGRRRVVLDVSTPHERPGRRGVRSIPPIGSARVSRRRSDAGRRREPLAELRRGI